MERDTKTQDPVATAGEAVEAVGTGSGFDLGGLGSGVERRGETAADEPAEPARSDRRRRAARRSGDAPGQAG